jgi:hypothetical protein
LEGFELNGTRQIMGCADYVDLYGENLHGTTKDRKPLLEASKEYSLEINAGRLTRKLMSRHQIAGQNHNIKVTIKYFENVAHIWGCR